MIRAGPLSGVPMVAMPSAASARCVSAKPSMPWSSMWLLASDSTSRSGAMPAAASVSDRNAAVMAWRAPAAVPSGLRTRSTTGLSQLPITRSAEASNALSRASTIGAVRLATAEMSPMKTSRLVAAG